MQPAVLQALSEFDPSLRDGGRLVSEKLCNVELRLPPESGEGVAASSVSAGSEKLVMKVVAFDDDKEARLHSVVLELLSESDVFFHYIREFGPREFAGLQESQRLMVSFEDFPELLADLSAQCAADASEDSSVRCSFVLVDSSTARVDFISVAHAFRYVELLSLTLDVADQRDTQLLVAYRFNELRSRLALTETRLNDLARAVQTKYPHILTAREVGSPETEGA